MDNSKIKIPTHPEKRTPGPFQTSDLYLAAYIKAKGIPLDNFHAVGGKVFFTFEDDGQIQGLLREYFSNQKVGVLNYKASLKDLKGVIANCRGMRGELKNERQ